MLGRCPIKTSKEWQEILASVNGNEARALEEWNKREDLANNDDLHEMVEIDETIEAEKEAIEPTNYAEAVKRIKIFLRQQLNELSKKKVVNQKAKTSQLNTLMNNIKKVEDVEAIEIFVSDAFEKAQAEVKNYQEVIEAKKNGNIDTKVFLNRLVEILDFAKGYSILDEISNIDINKYFSGPLSAKPISEYTPQDKIKYVLQVREQIKTAFVQEAIPLMAETLVSYRRSNSNKTITEQIKAFEDRIEEIRKSDMSDKVKEKDIDFNKKELAKWKNMLLDKNRMEEILRMAVKDEGVLDYLVSPLISSEDSALALFAKMVKSNFEEARMEDISEKNLAVEALNRFKDATGRSINNVAEFNDGIYEEVSVLRREASGKASKDENGLIFDKRMSFVQKYDLNKYAEAQSQWYKDNPRPILEEDATIKEQADYDIAIKKWYAERTLWYGRNTQPKSKEEIQKILKEQKDDLEAGIITDEEYDTWKKSVIYEKKGQKIFMRELAEPSDKYLNPKWQALYDKDGNPISPQGEYHKELTDTYLRDQELLPKAQQMGYILPSIEMSDWERRQRKGAVNLIKNKAKEAVKIQAYDRDLYGDQLDRPEGEDRDTRPYGTETISADSARILPVYYTQPMDADDVSVDLISSVLKFGSMARRYDAMNKIHAEITAFRTILDSRQVPALNAKGESILNKTAKRLGFEEYIRKNGIPNSTLHANAFIEMVIQGQAQQAETLFGFEVSKITNSLMGVAAVTTLAADILKGVANNIQGNIQVLIEAAGGEFFNGKNLARGTAKYWATVGANIGDFAKRTPESWLGRLIEVYDPIQGTFKDEFGKDVSASVANKLFRTNTLFFNQNFAEHEIQVKTMLALMDGTEVIDKETGKTISLLEAHEKYGSQLYEIKTDDSGKKYKDYKIQVKIETAQGVEEIVEFDEKERQEFMNTLHALNKRMHGVYNDFDKGTAQKYALGRLLLMYRKHMVPGYKRRYKAPSFDEELGAPTEGTYRVFWRTLLKDTVRYKAQVTKRWAGYTPFEKAQIRKVVAELSMIMALATIIMILEAMAGGDDDEEKREMPYAYYFMLYQAIRMRSETASYLSPADAWRVVRSPSAMMGVIDRFTKFADQLLFTWDPEKLSYKRDTGVWEKGDNKSWAYFLKVMGYSGYNFTPEEAVKSFKSTFVK